MENSAIFKVYKGDFPELKTASAAEINEFKSSKNYLDNKLNMWLQLQRSSNTRLVIKNFQQSDKKVNFIVKLGNLCKRSPPDSGILYEENNNNQPLLNISCWEKILNKLNLTDLSSMREVCKMTSYLADKIFEKRLYDFMEKEFEKGTFKEGLTRGPSRIHLFAVKSPKSKNTILADLNVTDTLNLG